MAFATTQVRADTSGSHKVLKGKWSGAIGDAAGTITIATTNIISAVFDDQDTAGSPADSKVLVSSTTSGRNTTLSIHNHNTVTTGRFVVEFD